MSRYLSFLYGLGCYASFLAVFLYTIAFVNNLWVPAGIDAGEKSSVGLAVHERISFTNASWMSAVGCNVCPGF